MIIKKAKALPAFTAGDDTLIREVLHPGNDELALGYSLALASLDAGRSSKPHMLRNSSETYIIQKGRGRAFVGAEVVDVEAGDLVFIPAGERQYIENIGEGLLEFWCVVAPPWSEEDEVVD